MGPDVRHTVAGDGVAQEYFSLAGLEAVIQGNGRNREAALVGVDRIGGEADMFPHGLGQSGHGCLLTDHS